MQLCAQRRQRFVNIIPMAALGVLSGELTKLTSRQTSASSSYCLLLPLYLDLPVSSFWPTLILSPKSPPAGNPGQRCLVPTPLWCVHRGWSESSAGTHRAAQAAGAVWDTGEDSSHGRAALVVQQGPVLLFLCILPLLLLCVMGVFSLTCLVSPSLIYWG